MNNEQMLFWLWLTLSQKAAMKVIGRLYERFGSARGIYAATAAQLKEAGVRENVLKVLANKDLSAAEKELEALCRMQAQLVDYYHPDYPALLKEITAPPPLLYVLGDIKALNEIPPVTIVASRRSTQDGLNILRRFSADIADYGFVVVSGFAERGDTAAHVGALSVNGRTAAVLGNGIDVVYPLENKDLVDKILSNNGVIISEFPLGTHALPQNFPIRNRILSGVSYAVIAGETNGAHSGVLITASHARAQNREVFALPQTLSNPNSTETNRLIQDGAHIILSVDSVVDVFAIDRPDLIEIIKQNRNKTTVHEEYTNIMPSAPEPPSVTRREIPGLSGREAKVMEHVGLEPVHIDTLARNCGMSARDMSALITSLELRGAIRALPGNQYTIQDI